MAYTTAGRIVAPKVRGASVGTSGGGCAALLRHGIESVLVTDEGLLEVLGEAQARRGLPQCLILKGSVMPRSRQSGFRWNLERLGLTRSTSRRI